MHILIIPSERYLPPESHLEGIFQRDQGMALTRRGHRLGVIVPHLHPLRTLRTAKNIRQRGLEVEKIDDIAVYRYNNWLWIPRIKLGYIWLWLRVGKTLWKKYIIDNGKPDLIHAHNALYAGYLASIIKRKYDIPYVLTEHSSDHALGKVSNYQVPLAKMAYQEAKARIVVSPKLGEDLEARYKDAFTPWEWVPNILDSIFEKEVILGNQSRQADRPFIFLSIGNLTENKGFSDLIKAFAQKFKHQPRYQLRIGGEGITRNQLVELAQQLGIEQQVSFLGLLSRPQVLEEMLACDVFVLASHYESFGVVLIEALACGKPVVATACGGPECIVKAKNGYLVPPGDVAALGEAMETVVRKIDSFNPVSIREECLSLFGTKVIAEKLTNIYSS
jgi:glycosyltransferase involved in cell wall biosynthesis